MVKMNIAQKHIMFALFCMSMILCRLQLVRGTEKHPNRTFTSNIHCPTECSCINSSRSYEVTCQVTDGHFPQNLPPEMQKLDITGPVTSISKENFGNMTNLESIYMVHHINNIHTDAFDDLHLQNLSIIGSHVRKFPKIIYESLTLTKLELINVITLDPWETVRMPNITAPSLHTLDISSNIGLFTQHIDLSGLRNLTTLSMCCCSSAKTAIVLTNQLELGRQHQLTYLDLSANQFHFLYVLDIFWRTPNLKILNLSKNNLDGLTPDDLALLIYPLKKIEELDISSTNVELISTNFLTNHRLIRKLDMKNNKLTYLSGDLFTSSGHLVHLDIQFNAFVIFPEEFVNGLLSSVLDEFRFHGNSLKCDCTIRYFQNWLKATRILTDKNEKCFNLNQKIVAYKLRWVECDNNKLTVAIVTPVVVAACILITVMLLIYFKWEIRYWFLMRKVRKRRELQVLINNEQEPGVQYDAFVSYNSANSDWVHSQLIEHLEGEDKNIPFKLLIDERDFLPGNYIIDNIANAIDQSCKVIFVVTKQFIQSQWCEYEVKFAEYSSVEKGRNLIIMILLEDIPPSDMSKTLRRLRRHVTFLDWPHNQNKRQIDLFWKKLIIALEKK